MTRLIPSRRAFITGGLGLIAAPAVVRAESLMRLPKPVFDPKAVLAQMEAAMANFPPVDPSVYLTGSYIFFISEKSGQMMRTTVQPEDFYARW